MVNFLLYTKDIYDYEFVNYNNEVIPDIRIRHLYEKLYETILNEDDELVIVRRNDEVFRMPTNHYLIVMD